MAKTILQGPEPGKRKRGSSRRSWRNDIREWTGLGRRNLEAKAHH